MISDERKREIIEALDGFVFGNLESQWKEDLMAEGEFTEAEAEVAWDFLDSALLNFKIKTLEAVQ